MTPPLRRSCVAALALYPNPFAFTLARLSHTGVGANQSALSGGVCHISRRARVLKVSRKSFPGPGTRLQIARELSIGRLFSHSLHQCFSVTRRKGWTTNTTAEILTTQNKHVHADAVRYYLDRRTLEAHLISLLDAAHLEQVRGVLAGAPVFAVLSRQATEQIRNHCSCWQLDPRRVEAEIPSIAELRRLSVRVVSAGTGHGGSWWLTIGLAVLAISVALTSE
jgi:hypothetical protein